MGVRFLICDCRYEELDHGKSFVRVALLNEPSKMAAECSPGRKARGERKREILQPSKRATEMKKRLIDRPRGVRSYKRRYSHLILKGVEFFEWDETTRKIIKV